MGFSQIRPNPTISSKKKMHISEKKSSFRREFSSFRRNFPISGKNFQFLAKIPDSGDAFFSYFDAFFNSDNRSDQTNANHHRKPNRPIFPAVGFGLLRPFTRRRRVESGFGRKPTRPDLWTTLIVVTCELLSPPPKVKVKHILSYKYDITMFKLINYHFFIR